MDMNQTKKGKLKFFILSIIFNSIEDGGLATEKLKIIINRLFDENRYTCLNQEIDQMIDHLIQTEQLFVSLGSLSLGKIIFEQDIEGYKVSINAEKIALQILEDMDVRFGMGTEKWTEDIRAEAINQWAYYIDLKTVKGVSNEN